MHTLLFHDPQEGTLYDHPYFGQLFLAGILSIIGYPSSLYPSAHGDVVHSVELLWLVPRTLMGILAVLDTLLVFKICENRYNQTVALVASILFAVMPTISFLRTVFLESLLLPFLLSSILFAVYGKHYAEKNKKENEIMLLLSGLFLGLAIFTKISAFLMIPLVIYIIYTNNNKSWKPWAIWFTPLFLIPLIWPLYAVIDGQFDNWWNGVYWQTHRHGAGAMEVDKSKTLSNALINIFLKMPVWILSGFAGLLFAAVRRDLFLLLWIVPFLIFFYIIGFVRDFHLIPLLPAFCISAAMLIVELSYKIFRKEKIRQALQFSIISAIAVFGLVNITTSLGTNTNDNKFAAAAFVTRYLSDNQYANVTVISNHVYSRDGIICFRCRSRQDSTASTFLSISRTSRYKPD
jgi:4-amino-4-deoxy-L-arabinose transferase-like glycosyltransferase